MISTTKVGRNDLSLTEELSCQCNIYIYLKNARNTGEYIVLYQ